MSLIALQVERTGTLCYNVLSLLGIKSHVFQSLMRLQHSYSFFV